MADQKEFKKTKDLIDEFSNRKVPYTYQWATDKMFKDIWQGEDGLIIGGGYRNRKREYQRDEKLDAFQGKVFGCNSAFKVRKIDVLVWIDTATYRNFNKEIAAFEGLKFAVNPRWPVRNLNFWAIKPGKVPKCSESFEDGIAPRNLSGYVAINIALLMGIKRVFLTGFNSADCNILKYTKNFIFFKEFAESNNREIYSCDPDGITNGFFPYMPLREILCVPA